MGRGSNPRYLLHRLQTLYHSAIENCGTYLIMQWYLKQIAYRAALNKRLFSAALNHCTVSCY